MTDDLPVPSLRRLIVATILALAAACTILITIVLPAEFGIDKTGVGRVLGLTEMGRAKREAAEFAEVGALIAEHLAALPAMVAPRSDTTEITIPPGRGLEVKLVMRKGAKARFDWRADGPVLVDQHGEGPAGDAATYFRSTDEIAGSGLLQAELDGHHGWYWRNTGAAPVVLVLKTEGEYGSVVQMP